MSGSVLFISDGAPAVEVLAPGLSFARKIGENRQGHSRVVLYTIHIIVDRIGHPEILNLEVMTNRRTLKAKIMLPPTGRST